MENEKIYGYSEEELSTMLPYFVYKPVNWKDIIPEFANTWEEEDIGNGAISHKRFTGRVFQEGTPRNAENLGNEDLGIYLLWILARTLEGKVGKLELDIENMKNAMFNNLTNNVFSANFNVLDADIEIIDGYYDEVRKEVSC